MSDLTHLFRVGQSVRCDFDGKFYDGTVKIVYEDSIIVDVPAVSDHCMFEKDCNLDCVYSVHTVRAITKF